MSHGEYDYRVLKVPNVVDGDTFDFDVDLGLYVKARIRIRLADSDTYEVYGRNAHPLGIPAKEHTRAWLSERLERRDLRVETFELNPGTPISDGSFGRWLGEVYDSSNSDLLAHSLEEAGFEKPPEVSRAHLFRRP